MEVLRGDPERAAAAADALQFKHRYTSGVLAWAPEDRPTDVQVGRALDEFERTAWAGLDRDRYAWTAVLHRESGGGVHVHVLAARCDLATGRSLNVAPPDWRETYDSLRDWLNAEHGWGQPDAPARKRAARPARRGCGPGWMPSRTRGSCWGNTCWDASRRARRATGRAWWRRSRTPGWRCRGRAGTTSRRGIRRAGRSGG